MRRVTSIAATAATAAVAAAAALAATASAERPPSGEEALGNNLSVPAIFVPSIPTTPALRIPCPADADLTYPGWDGEPASVAYPDYWLQKTAATWSAACEVDGDGRAVTADWGDNLTAGSLAAGRPIRVEMGLLDPTATGMRGYLVDNLTPTLEDRLATYGSKPTNAYLTGDAGKPVTRVYDPGATIKIEKQVSAGVWEPILSEQTMTAEINSTGAVVYGYNWGIKGRSKTAVAGTYRLTFRVPERTQITALSDVGTLREPTLDTTANSTSVVVTLTSTSGGKGKPTAATGKAGAKGAKATLRGRG